MNNQSFRNEVYKKYAYYKNIKDDDFFYKHQYRKINSNILLNKIATFLIIGIFTTGVVYAASNYIKNIWKNPKEYNYNESKQVVQKDIDESMTENEAKQIGLKTLKEMNMEIGNIKNSYLNKEPSIDKIEWVIETDNDLEIRINAKNGELYSFSNNRLLNSVNNSTLNEEAAIKVSKEIYDSLSYKKNYEFSCISNLENGKWQADYCIKYGDIYNPYQCVRITFIAESKELVMLNVFDYDFENNPYEISEEEALAIVKNKYGEENIKTISAKKDIQKMNTIIYQKENETTTGEYKIDNIVRNIWNVELKEKKYGFVENYYIDATTGEIIGGNQKK